ncbi:MAG: porin [Solirubrobacterales bacterium]|nr:porin [Solirubrobacterales bacterium]
MELQRKLVVEFIGTFFFVFAIGEALTNAGRFAPLAIGAALMVMVFAGGHISGGHFNPAVSTAAAVRGKLPSNELIPYFVAQGAGALVAALIFLGVEEDAATFEFAGAGTMLVVEFLFTFALCWVVLHTATSAATEGNSFYGLAIGFTVLAGVYAVGALSGGAFNPAVAFGAMIMGFFAWSDIWIYLIANFLGGAAAAIAFLYVNPAEEPEPREAETAPPRDRRRRREAEPPPPRDWGPEP